MIRKVSTICLGALRSYCTALKATTRIVSGEKEAESRCAANRASSNCLVCLSEYRVSARQIALAFALALAVSAIAATSLSFSPSTAQTQRECPVRVTLLQLNDVYQFAPVNGGTRFSCWPATRSRRRSNPTRIKASK